jgi:hypothetical protein
LYSSSDTRHKTLIEQHNKAESSPEETVNGEAEVPKQQAESEPVKQQTEPEKREPLKTDVDF